jgi:hypothetical protein
MKKNKLLFVSIIMMIIGLILNGLAWSSIIGGHPNSTICLVLGLGLFCLGLLFFILSFAKK